MPNSADTEDVFDVFGSSGGETSKDNDLAYEYTEDEERVQRLVDEGVARDVARALVSGEELPLDLLA
jgi:hypothetical protein